MSLREFVTLAVASVLMPALGASGGASGDVAREAPATEIDVRAELWSLARSAQGDGRLQTFAARAARGDVDAMCELGRIYRNGLGLATNAVLARKWTLAAASNGCLSAVALCHEFGYGVPTNCERAVQWYFKAAARGETRAKRALGGCYERGEGVPVNRSEAAKWYRSAAESGDVDAMIDLAHLLLCRDDEKDLREGLSWGQRAMRKEASDAFKWYRKAAYNGSAVGMRKLGWCFLRGEGVDANASVAVKWYRKAAERGDAEGMRFLGLCYALGLGIEQNATEAVKWFRKAAKVGDAESMVCLGSCYKMGQGVAQDARMVVKWYRKAAESGDPQGMRCLGVCYERGYGIEASKTEAAAWYRKAAERGHTESMRYLGDCYGSGAGVPRDMTEAVRWYRRAAKDDDARAMRRLAFCYSQGRGVRVDAAQARYWTKKAIDNGEEFSLMDKFALKGKFCFATKCSVVVLMAFMFLLVHGTGRTPRADQDATAVEVPTKWSLRMGTFHGAPVSVGASVLIWVLFDIKDFFSPDFDWGAQLLGYAGLVFSLLIHELAHARVGLYTGACVKRVTLQFFGGFCEFDRPTNALVALAGPLANLALAVAFYVLEWENLLWINLSLAAFNLLPVYPLDGGRVFLALIPRALRGKAVGVVVWLNRILGGGFMALGVLSLSDASLWGLLDLLIGGAIIVFSREWVTEALTPMPPPNSDQ